MKRPLVTSRDKVEVEKRVSIAPAIRARVIAKSDGHCAYPGCEETKGLEIDHVIARGLGGKNAESNYTALCDPHHAQKTKLDVKMIAKAKRLAGETCAAPTKRPLQSRGFQTTMTRGFDGVVRPRKKR